MMMDGHGGFRARFGFGRGRGVPPPPAMMSSGNCGNGAGFGRGHSVPRVLLPAKFEEAEKLQPKMVGGSCGIGTGLGRGRSVPRVLPTVHEEADSDSDSTDDSHIGNFLSTIRLGVRRSREAGISSRSFVRGMACNFQFMTHSHPNQYGTFNMFEITMCTEMFKHLMRQSYSQEQILILTTSSQQQTTMIEHINSLAVNDPAKRVTVEQVTNFLKPDHPAVDIVLFSLSSTYNNLINPFLVTTLEMENSVRMINYITGCYKKKRLGCYIFGHSSIPNIPGGMSEFCFGLEDMGALGDFVTLRCRNHDIDTMIRWADQIIHEAPFGGCTEICLRKLPNCKHSCPYNCHAADPHHLELECRLLCENTCPYGHSCGLSCGLCGPCIIEVSEECPSCTRVSVTECCRRGKLNCGGLIFKALECGHRALQICGQPIPVCEEDVIVRRQGCTHKVAVKCHQRRDAMYHNLVTGTLLDFPCDKPCERMACLANHKCLNKCSEPCSKCQVKVVKTFEGCEHTAEVECGSNHRFTQCEEICTTDFVVDCGHQITAPCHQTQRLSDKELTKLCTRACEEVLACGHPCTGTCMACNQGMFHLRCAIPIEIDRRCGHVFIGLCDELGPCEQPCLAFCEHGKCELKCGIPCTPCREPCTWKCPHLQCTKTCSEVCNRNICWRMCKKILNCGHQCVGYCGLPCPNLCRVCDKEALMDAYLMGQDYDAEDRFLVLESCGHVLEMDSFQMLMQTNVETEYSEDQNKKCPFCRSIIWNCRQFSKIVHDMQKNIMLSKYDYYGDPEHRLTDQVAAFQKLTESRTRMSREFDRFRTFQRFLLNALFAGTDPDLGQFDQNMTAKTASDIFRLANACYKATFFVQSADRAKERELLFNVFDRIFTWVMSRPFPPSEHESQDIQFELQRGNDMLKLFETYGTYNESVAAGIKRNNPGTHDGFTDALNALLYDCAYNATTQELYRLGFAKMETASNEQQPRPR